MKYNGTSLLQSLKGLIKIGRNIKMVVLLKLFYNETYCLFLLGHSESFLQGSHLSRVVVKWGSTVYTWFRS